MRSRMNATISASQVHKWTLNRLEQSGVLKTNGWLCTVSVVWNIVLRAAARSISIFAACRDLANAPSDQAVYNALASGLPKTLSVLERRLNQALVNRLSRGMRRRRLEIAIDWHLVPYYGEPHASRNELYYGQPKQGTSQFHAYATACVVEYGQRYTLALTWVRRHEKTQAVLQRLLDRLRNLQARVRCVLLDRAFFSVPVVRWLQDENLPFLMPVMFRGRRPKKPAKTGLRWIQRQKAGWYSHTMKNTSDAATIRVCVGFRRHTNRKDKKQRTQKLLFAAWRINGSPVEIRERYRTRFGIESSYRQIRQARIYTCTRDPHQRLVYIAVSLLIRNMWVWIHDTQLADGSGPSRTIRQERLRFKRLLEWIALIVSAKLHDGSEPYVEF